MSDRRHAALYAAADADPTDPRLFAPTFPRNSPPMIRALTPVLDGKRGPVLEIGSGTGQHAAALALAFPEFDWWPSDPEPAHRASAAAWARVLRAPERAPLNLDAASDWAKTAPVLALGPLAAVLSMNVIHIAPWDVARGIVGGAAEALAGDGLLIFYGPFHIAGQATGRGNAAFDADLRARDPAWGVRDLNDLTGLAQQSGFGSPEVRVMPADNRLVILPRQARTARV